MKTAAIDRSKITRRIDIKWITGLFVTIVCCAFYALLVSFRTMPISEGWYTEYAWQINHGQLPYRDFEYLFFPLYMFIIAGFTKVFGYSIFALRFLGVLVYAGIGAALYCIFAKLFDNLSALIGAVATALFMQSEIAQVFYDYIRFHDLFVFICTYFFLSLFIQCYQGVDFRQEKSATVSGAITCYIVPAIFLLIGLVGEIMRPVYRHPRSGTVFLIAIFSSLYVLANSVYQHYKGKKLNEYGIPLNAILCGIFAAAECMVKQSNGTLMIIMIAIFLLYCDFVLNNKRFLKAFCGYGVGIFLAFSGLITYLVLTETLSDFWRCCFGNALSAKGGAVRALFRWILPSLQSAITGPNIVIVVLMIYIGVLLYRSKSSTCEIRISTRGILAAGIALAAWEWIFFEGERLASDLINKYNSGIPGYVFFPCAIIFFIYAFYLLVCWGRKKTPEGLWATLLPVFPVLGVIFAQGYGVGMSGGLGTSQVAIAVGLIAAFCIQSALIAGAKTMLCCLLAATMALSSTFISRKTIQTYDWWGLLQNRISEHTETVDVPLLEGILVRPVDKQCYETVYQDVISNTEPGDCIFVFPHCPIFYTITNRHSETYSKVQWFDVSSEVAINRDIETLRTNNPQMIVYVELPEWVYEGHESSFRTYQTRKMKDFLLNELISQQHYEMLSQIDIGNGFIVYTYCR